jgi:midasin (ATPase involved in ribosome maturation)
MSADDEQHRNIVLFVFFSSYLYFYYVQTKIDLQKDWANRKCNPLNMFIGSLYMPNDDSTKNFGTCVSKYTTDMIESQVTNISNTTMGQLTTSVDTLNTNMNNLSKNIDQTQTNLNKKYSVTNTSIADLNEKYGTEGDAKNILSGKITTFTGEMLNIFEHIKDYVKKV